MQHALATLEDDALLDLIKADNRIAFNEMYNRYWDRLYATAFHHLKDSTAAEEIVQDAFITIWQKRNDLHIESLSKYLSAMIRYAVYRWMAKEHQRQQHQLSASGLSPATTAAKDVDHKLLLEIVDKLSSELPEKCRLVFRANKLYDQPLDDVARELNISQKTAEAHLTKALKIIRLNLGKAFHFFSWIL
jgi:RNA polymerase sigma-70 factor (ECF subfamily)